jgi:hypothetical protein
MQPADFASAFPTLTCSSRATSFGNLKFRFTFASGFRNRMLVLVHWFWTWVLNSRDARRITGDAHIDVQQPRSAGFQATAEPKLNETNAAPNAAPKSTTA